MSPSISQKVLRKFMKVNTYFNICRDFLSRIITFCKLLNALR